MKLFIRRLESPDRQKPAFWLMISNNHQPNRGKLAAFARRAYALSARRLGFRWNAGRFARGLARNLQSPRGRTALSADRRSRRRPVDVHARVHAPPRHLG